MSINLNINIIGSGFEGLKAAADLSTKINRQNARTTSKLSTTPSKPIVNTPRSSITFNRPIEINFKRLPSDGRNVPVYYYGDPRLIRTIERTSRYYSRYTYRNGEIVEAIEYENNEVYDSANLGSNIFESKLKVNGVDVNKMSSKDKTLYLRENKLLLDGQFKRRKRDEEDIAIIESVVRIGHGLESTAIESRLIENVTWIQPTSPGGGYVIEGGEESVIDSISWTVLSGDRSASISDSISIIQPSLPSGQINVTVEPIPDIRTATINQQILSIHRHGFYATGGSWVQVLGNVTLTTATIPGGTITGEQTDDAISQLGGPWPSFNEQRDALIAAQPPAPPNDSGGEYQYYDEEEISTSSTTQQVTIQDSNAGYLHSWSATASYYDSILDYGWFALPVGKDVCILVLMVNYAHVNIVKNLTGTYTLSSINTNPSSVYYQGQLGDSIPEVKRFNKAYLCSKTSVRNIDIPQVFSTVLDSLNPELEIDGISLPGPDPIYTLYADDSSSGFYSTSLNDGLTWSPSVFGVINTISQFTDPSNIKPFPSRKAPILIDYRDGYYKFWIGEDNEDDWSHYYAKWTGDPSNVDIGQLEYFRRLNGSTLRLDAQPDLSYNLFVTWDWDDPSYCRMMCSQLGFTSSSLTP